MSTGKPKMKRELANLGVDENILLEWSLNSM
jgi:hypothetical protein